MTTFQQLRSQYPLMIYEGFVVKNTAPFLFITYHFNLNHQIHFYHPISIRLCPDEHDLCHPLVQNILFNIGLVELISYWKCACPPKVIIKAANMDDEQILWWKKLFFCGLSEFFYRNNIETTIEEFMQIERNHTVKNCTFNRWEVNDENLIPLGGGKDSVVTLHILKDLKEKNYLFAINPTVATLLCAYRAGYPSDKIIKVHRSIDKTLLSLNTKGYLNGHIPFSAVVAFISLLISVLTKKKYIILSNEQSANEPTVLNTKINHQYSKSYEFEQDFSQYVAKYITPDIYYFSILRPLNEFRIIKIFSQLEEFLFLFKSCNVGAKENRWCAKCAKCLFVYIMLSPHISQEKLIKIFGHNLLDDISLIDDFKKLTGIAEVKPFECIGTKEEVNASLSLFIKHQQDGRMPYLVKFWKEKNSILSDEEINKVANYFNENHLIPIDFLDFLKKSI